MDAWKVIIGWLIIAAGWLANHWLTAKRERNNRIITQLDAFIEMVSKLEEHAVNYHTEQQRNFNLERKLLTGSKRVSSEAHRLSELVLDKEKTKSARRLVFEVKDAITLDNFNTKNFIQQSSNSRILNNIEASCSSLIIFFTDARGDFDKNSSSFSGIFGFKRA